MGEVWKWLEDATAPTCCVRPHIAVEGVAPQQRVRDKLGEGADVVHVAHEPGRHGQHEAWDETTTPGDREVKSHLQGGGRVQCGWGVLAHVAGGHRMQLWVVWITGR